MDSLATKVDRAELLEIQNLDLQRQLVEAKHEALAQRLLRRYGAPGQENLTIRDDGTIDRPLPATQDPGGTSVPG